MSADNFLGIYKKDNEFIARSCWSECEEDECEQCLNRIVFNAYSLSEAVSLAEQEMETGDYEYGYRFLNLNDSLASVSSNTITDGRQYVWSKDEIKESKSLPFWICYVDGKMTNPFRHHLTEPEARKECERLAKLPDNKGKRVWLLECVGECQEQGVKWEIPQ